MAAFNPALQSGGGGKGSSPGFRFTLYAIVSIGLMFLDQRQKYLEQARYVLQGVAFPVQLAVSSPSKAVSWVQENTQAREVLEAENKRLRAEQLELKLKLMDYDKLAKENGELRGLKDALPPVVDRWLPAEIVQVEVDSLRQRILINRGTTNGVFKGQTVVDDAGIIGQTTHVGPWSAEVILITDPEHAIPVQVERTVRDEKGVVQKDKDGNDKTVTTLRTIAVGGGDQDGTLALPHLSVNADIQAGDRLLSSGLGGVFPSGYPVAKVTEVNKDKSGVNPLAQIRAVPYARLASDREVVLVWFREGHPASPVDLADGGDLKAGNAAMQAQNAPKAEPPKPEAAKPEAPKHEGGAAEPAPPAAGAPAGAPAGGAAASAHPAAGAPAAPPGAHPAAGGAAAPPAVHPAAGAAPATHPAAAGTASAKPPVKPPAPPAHGAHTPGRRP